MPCSGIDPIPLVDYNLVEQDDQGTMFMKGH